MIGPEGENLIFVVSQPRAGSTLLQRILGGHPQVHTTAEPWIMLHPLFGLKKSGIHAAYDHTLGRQALEDFCSTLPDGREACLRAVRAMGLELYNSALAGTGKSRFLDKTPRYYFILPELAEVFPRASLVLLFRNPLAVLSSILDSWLSWGKWWENEAIAQYRYDLLEAPRRLVEGREALGKKAVILHYEELVSRPEEVTRGLCDRLGLPFQHEMLAYGGKPKPAGRFGDTTGIGKHDQPVAQYVKKWVGRFADPRKRHLGRAYLSLLGPNLLERMGYSFVELQEDLLSAGGAEELLPEGEVEKIARVVELLGRLEEVDRSPFPSLEAQERGNGGGTPPPEKAPAGTVSVDGRSTGEKNTAAETAVVAAPSADVDTPTAPHPAPAGMRVRDPEEIAPLFIVGLPRTGTTALLRAVETMEAFRGRHKEGHISYWLLAGLRDLLENPDRYARTFRHTSMCHGENFDRLLAWIARGIDGFKREIMGGRTDGRWVDKTPDIEQMKVLPTLQRVFPNARVIFLTRHPRDQIISQRRKHGADGSDERMLNHWVQFHSIYREAIRPRLKPGTILELRQEDMARDPVGTGHRVGAFLEASGEEAVRIGNYLASKRENRSPETDEQQFDYTGQAGQEFLSLLERICGEEMKHWGYRPAGQSTTHHAGKVER